MIAVDTNILVYAHREGLPQHAKAKECLKRLAEGSHRWAIPVFCLGEFLRVITHVRVWDPPFSSEEASLAIKNVLASPSLQILMPGSLYLNTMLQVVEQSRATGNLLFDAQIAALCVEHGVSYLLTEDRDFARFPSVATKSMADFL